MVLLSLSFPYKSEKIGNGEIFRPKIPITVSNGDRRADVSGLLDSGSDVSVIPKTLAEQLGLGHSGIQHGIEGFGGAVTGAFDSSVGLTLRKGGEVHRFMLPVVVQMSDLDKDVILGRGAFFREFDITFQENSGRVVLSRVRH